MNDKGSKRFPWPPGIEPISDADLVRRVVWSGPPRGTSLDSHVMDVFCVGSGVARALCRRFDCDPDTGARLPPDTAEAPEATEAPEAATDLRLQMQYCGAKWLRQHLSYERPPREPSPFGDSVADLLGYCFAGLYHMPPVALRDAEWESEHGIVVKLYPGEIASWDYNTLTSLVVVGHDMGIRVSVQSNGTRGLRVCLSRRRGRFVERRKSCAATTIPTLEDHVAWIREGYTVVARPDGGEVK